jgi:acyl-CoA thioester hydrolase
MENEIELSVRYNETDEMGVVYHANYLIWFDLGRTSFFEELGFTLNEVKERGIIFPVREINIKYFRPARFGDKVKVKTKVLEFNKVRTTYAHKIFNEKGELLVEGTSTVVCVETKTFRPVMINKYLPEVFKIYESLANKGK